MDTYDYVIVGAGSAGCVLAHRLSADSSRRVLLIEAGGPDRHPLIHMPRALAKIMGNPRYIWPFMTEPESASNAAGEFWARGRTLGGSSSVNGMMYVRGQAADYSALAACTSEDWNWEKIGAAYKALENHELGAAPTRGDHGPLHISMPRSRAALTERLVQACAAMGMQVQEDVNDPADTERVGYMPCTVFEGRRQSAAVAFLKPALKRNNLTVITDFLADKVLFDGRRAIGVSGSKAGHPVTVHAGREVLISAGAIGSPAILQRSGIGPAAHLQKINVPILQDSPGVGGNLREHRGIVMQWSVPDEQSENREYRGIRLAANVMKYFAFHEGPMAKPAFDVGAWFKSCPEAERPDGQFLLSPYSFDYTSASPAAERTGGIICCVYNLRPESTGTVLIRSPNPAELPRIQPNYGSAERDLELMVDLVRHARRIVQQSPLAELVQHETRPGAEYQTNEEIREAHRKFGYTNYHACGTCRMGSDAEAVLDPDLKVRGLDALRVVDASIFPFMLAGNINAPVMAMAWRGADLILRDA